MFCNISLCSYILTSYQLSPRASNTCYTGETITYRAYTLTGSNETHINMDKGMTCQTLNTITIATLSQFHNLRTHALYKTNTQSI